MFSSLCFCCVKSVGLFDIKFNYTVIHSLDYLNLLKKLSRSQYLMRR